jgi:hypothetical protein
LIDNIGANENFDSAISYADNGFSVALINHNAFDLEITLKSAAKISTCVARETSAAAERTPSNFWHLKTKNSGQ